MTDRQARAACNRQESLDAFLAEKARFDAIVAELQQMSADHFGADPEAVLWGEQVTLQHWNSLLARVTDAYFKRESGPSSRACPSAAPTGHSRRGSGP